jgi:hypothetical protein
VARLDAAHSLLAGYHNPQGRAIALLRLLQAAPQDVLAVLPRELAATVAARLKKFILRAKVTVTDESTQWQVTGLIAPTRPAPAAPALAPELPGTVHGVARVGGALAVRVGEQPGRWLLIAPADSASGTPGRAALLPGVAAAPYAQWEGVAVAAGEPQVYAVTSEEFVAQMLNLDVLGAIAFDKGCYTGQEVIARAHYRGRVKRRLQRFVTRHAAQLGPGDGGELGDGRAFKVVRAAARADGRCEFLAVAPLVAEAHGAQPRSQTRALEAEPLPLPYALPQ